MDGSGTTDFGFEQIPASEKSRRVARVFESVAGRYDLMNDLMSLGVHRLWKRFAVGVAAVRRGERVLDLAGGTGDLTRQLSPRVGRDGTVVLADINEAMLRVGRDRLLDEGLAANVRCVRTDAEALCFPDNTFDCVLIAFGLRNVTDKDQALRAMQRVLRPGGRVLVLEFSKLVVPILQRAYDAYSFRLLPALGQVVAGDRGSYRYLVESIRRHPDQPTLQRMMEAAGFSRAQYFNLSGGIVALHGGYKLGAKAISSRVARPALQTLRWRGAAF